MRPIALISLLLLAACKPSFDDRYDKADKDIHAQASGVDNDLAKQQMATPAAATDDPAVSPSPSDHPAE